VCDSPRASLLEILQEPGAPHAVPACGSLFSVGSAGAPVLVQFTEPDVAVADWVIVVLQSERELLRTGGVSRAHPESNPEPVSTTND